MRGEYRHEDVVTMIRERVEETSQVSTAEELGISTQYLNDILHGRRTCGLTVLDAMHLKEIRRYVDKSAHET